MITRPGSFFGFARVVSSSIAGWVPLANAMRLPSGDHAGEDAPPLRRVSWVASPPDIGRRWICPGFPSEPRTNASVVPSGDQRGCPSRGPAVSGRGAPPAVSASQMLVRYSSAAESVVTRTKATRAPSGEICGSATQTNR